MGLGLQRKHNTPVCICTVESRHSSRASKNHLRSKGGKLDNNKVLIDPIALKKKLSKMSTELGAFAVLSSLLFYLTDLIPRLSQIQSQRTTWLKNIENKVNSRREHANEHSGIRPTKFQLLQSRFMNSNREPYRKRSRDVGKLIVKEKQPTNRNVRNSIVSKLDRSSLTEEENLKITFQEKARWVSSCGKNTVKNVLKKFLAAEEKEAKEKQGTLKKKAPNDDLPKIHKKNSVLSKLKEKFEQTSNVCSAVDVKALLPRKDEKKNKKSLEKKPICKAEIRVLQIDLRTVTRFISPEPEQLVSMTVTMPQLCVATEISRPWSLSTNITHTPQPSDPNPEVQVAKVTRKTQDLKPDKNTMPDRKAHGGQQKGQLQNKCHEIPTVVTDQNDSIENDVPSANPGPNPDSISSSPKILIAGHIPNTPKKGLNHKENVMLPADNSFSGSEDKNTPPIARGKNRSTTCPSGLAEGISAHQEVKGDETSDISEGMRRPEETEIELAETTKEPPFASQKCLPELKVLENIPPFQCPAAQASCNAEGPPVNEQQSSVEPAAVDKMPQLKPSQGNEQDLRGKILDATQYKEKLPNKDETDFTHTENDHTNQVKQEAKPARSQSKESDLQIQSKHLFLKPQTQQNEQNNTSPTKETMKQGFQFPTSNNSQKNQSQHVKETYVCNNNCAIAVEDTGKTKVCSVNSVTGPQRNSEDTSISVSHLETSQGLLKEFFSHETQTLEENPGPFSKKCPLSTMDHSAKPESNIAEVNRPLCHVGNLKTPSSNESSNNESCIQGNKVASHNSEKDHVPSLNEVQKPKAAPGLDEKTVCNFHSDLTKSKNSAARDKDIFPKMLEKKYQPPSTKNIRKYEDSPVGETALIHNMETPEEHSRNNTGKQGRAQVMSERKSEKSNSPSQNETAGLGNNAVGKGNLPETAQWLIPSSVNRSEQEDNRVGEQSPVTTSKKIIHNSKIPPKSIKDDLTKEGRDTTETNISQAQQLTPPKSNSKRPNPDLTKEVRGATETNISQAQQLTPPKSFNKKAKTDVTEGRDATETSISQAQQLTPPKSNNKKAKIDVTEGRDATGTNSSQAQQLIQPKSNSKKEKTDLTKEVRDTRETNISQAQQLSPPKSNNKKEKTDVTKEVRDKTETNISQAQQLTPPKSKNKKAKTDVTEGRDTTETNISQAQQLIPPKSNSKRAKIDLTKEVRDTTETNISQAQQLTPPKNKTSSRGGSHFTKNSKYQTTPNDLEKYDSGKVEDENITKDLLSPLKVPMKYDGTSLEGRKAQTKIQDDKMSSPGDKLKSKSQIEKAREQTSKSRQKLLPLKSEHPKTKKTSVSEGNLLDSFQKDKVNNLVAEQEKPSSSYPRKPDMIAKGEQQALWNSEKDQLPLLEQKVKSHQNKVPSGKQQQQPQTPKDCVNPKSSLKNEQHAHNSRSNVPSLDEAEGNKNAHEKKGPSKNTDKQRASQLSQDRTFQKKKKMLCEADVEPQLGYSRNACTSERRKTQQSSGKYQIQSPHDLPKHESEEVKKYTVSAVQESKVRLVGLEKYIAESYSEGPTNISFKPMVIRAIDTIKLDN